MSGKTSPMYLCVDTHYFSKGAVVAGVVFRDAESDAIEKEYSLELRSVEKYEPGLFYRRELPGILELLDLVDFDIHTIIIDGYVWLDKGNKPGLGAYLYDALERRVNAIGVAKSPYKDVSMAVPVYRGRSRKPLYITATGIETKKAARLVKKMHGQYRLPTLLKHVDTLARSFSPSNAVHHV